MNEKTENISWEQFHKDTKLLASSVEKLDKPFVGIVAITRGGLVPAAILAHQLKIRLIDTYCLNSYTDDNKQTFITDLKPSLSWSDRMVLVVDELVDTGETTMFIRRKLPLCTFVAVYAKPLGRIAVDAYGVSVPQETWIRLPWET